MAHVPTPAETAFRQRVRPGDLWQLGPHRLLCGDSRDPDQVAYLMHGEQAALTVTSPPYNLGHSTNLGHSKEWGDSRYRGQTDTRSRTEYLDLLCSATENALNASTVVIVNLQMLAGNKVAVVEYLHFFRQHLIDIAVWNKGSAPPATAGKVMNSQFEWLIFLTLCKSKGRTTRAIPTANFRGTVANVYAGPQQRHNPYFRLHAATFPPHLPLWLIQTFDSSQGIVLDHFIGTGTTLLAAEQLGRRCYGMDIDPQYCEIVLSRWEQATKQKALRLSTTHIGSLTSAHLHKGQSEAGAEGPHMLLAP
jgi:DNA modification methylase